MSNNSRIGSKSAPFMRKDTNGMFSTPGPFIGIVKNNIDPTCAGRLQVYIPQYGKPNEDDPSGWLTVSYASPFRGQTKRRMDVSKYIDTHIDVTSDVNSTDENSFQSYGFWFVPPDINIRVLCTFVNGDPSQGYWTACIQDPFDAHMVPAIGAVRAATSDPNSGGYIWNPSKYKTHADLQQYIQLSDPKTGAIEIPYRLPVAEAVLTNQDNKTNLVNVQIVPQVAQTKILGIQGLAFDFSRGSTSASSTRENPSQVFGVSTPGRYSVFRDATSSAALLKLINQYNANPDAMDAGDKATLITALSSSYRAGGHQFVMDDGTVEGADQGIRIRSAGGNMVLLDDTNGQIYIVNASGNAWVELTRSGRIDIYANGFSVRSKGDINFQSDTDILFNAQNNIKMKAEGAMQFESSSTLTARAATDITLFAVNNMNLGASGSMTQYGKSNFNIKSDGLLVLKGSQLLLNSGSAPSVKDPGLLPTNKLIDTGQISGSKVWWQAGTTKSIVTRAPAHEPWPDHEVNSIVTFDVAQGVATGNVIQRPDQTGTSSGIRGTGPADVINEAAIAKQPDPLGKICNLSLPQTKAVLTQLAYRESRGNYKIVNSLGFSGKYQFGADALISCRYMKKGSHNSGTNLQAVSNPNNWTGKDGCTSQSAFLNSPVAQENAINILMNINCQTLRKLGVITSNTSAADVGGYLLAAHLGGAGSTHLFWKIQNGSGGTPFADANGTSIATYYAMGQKAVQLGTSNANA